MVVPMAAIAMPIPRYGPPADSTIVFGHYSRFVNRSMGFYEKKHAMEGKEAYVSPDLPLAYDDVTCEFLST
jgi:hypothetical protein